MKFDYFAQSMYMSMPQEPEGGEEVRELMLVSASMILLISCALFSLQKVIERKQNLAVRGDVSLEHHDFTDGACVAIQRTQRVGKR